MSTRTKNPEKDEEAATDVMPVIRDIVRESAGTTSLKDIADRLNARGIATPRGRRWDARSVARVLNERAASKLAESPE
jgi:hypothetical protein